MTTGSYEVVQTVQYESVDFVQISGSGATTITTDAGLIGGGFGVKGAVEGILAASVINALTRRTTTTIEAIVDSVAPAPAPAPNPAPAPAPVPLPFRMSSANTC